MARGLSNLQKTILLVALTKASQPESVGIDRWEVLTAYYGWQAAPRSARLTALRFKRQTVGEAKYMAAQVAVTRALQRLRRRGLLRPFTAGRGYTVTDAGAAIARELKVIG